MSESARNMPVDSIMTTIITSDIVRIITMSKVGMPKANGVTTSNQCALPTLSKFILPRAIAIAQPPTMPSSTEMLAMKPFMKRTSNRMKTKTVAAMAMLSSAP
jgi:hypothetical protein